MLKRLELTNFEKHESLVIDFTPGLNVIRAANEAGKSAVYRAIAYANWGSRALPFALDDHVTWGKPVSSLRVRQVFEVAGVEYTVTRSKSGAELVWAGGTSSGQAEVTAQIERLFGASMSVGLATLLTRQSMQADSLNGSAVALIEKLSDMELIESLILGIQKKLPSGNTRAIEAELAANSDIEKPETDFSALQDSVTQAEAALNLTVEKISQAEAVLADLSGPADEAKKRIKQQEALDALAKFARAKLAAIGDLEAPQVPVFARSIADLEAAQVVANAQAKAADYYANFLTIPDSEHVNAAEFKASETYVTEATAVVQAELAELKTKKSVLTSGLILATECNLCGKDLRTVEEVVTKNAQIREQIVSTNSLITVLESKLLDLQLKAKSHKLIRDQNHSISIIVAGLHKFVEIDNSVMPQSVKWVGPEATGVVDTTNYVHEIRVRRAAFTAYEKAKTAFELGVAQKQQLEAELANAEKQVVTGSDMAVVSKFIEAEALLSSLLLDKVANSHAVSSATAAMQSAVKIHALNLENYERLQESKTRLLETLKQYGFNNKLIQKLREVRPVVARELWAMVLKGVSATFSQMRGVNSTVTRSDSEFMIDGRKATQYSGSTQDTLGLAIRFMLQKTFLPNVNFTMLDEPASGCDAERETNMLATIARVDFAQTVLVTHSDLADAFASNFITLGNS